MGKLRKRSAQVVEDIYKRGCCETWIYIRVERLCPLNILFGFVRPSIRVSEGDHRTEKGVKLQDQADLSWFKSLFIYLLLQGTDRNHLR